MFESARRGGSEKHVSPIGCYELEIVTWEPPHGWAYSEGLVRRVGRHELIARILRNFDAFPFTWCEEHPTGHDYLIAGEDYQGQTIIELDTGARVDHLPDAAEQGFGFCWAGHLLSPRRDVLVVDGCYWAGPYELVAYDFSRPMHLPLTELHRWAGDLVSVDGFDSNDWLTWTFTRAVRVSDGKPYDDLTDDEEADLRDDDGRYRPELLGNQTYRARWRVGDPFEATQVELVGDGVA
ncbi:MAG TPA: hypothetical protein PLZ93_08070 [Nocardioides sp.]|nr:hypothetical protein [Nocardioides sp.]HRD63982.1 hypothetical protein [Nocardioides sp.]HRI95556.1 hypothetical protein [Nocardioides sp.]HRK45913.1 hypothetical protein [Nocardioides sp.]